MGCPHWTEVACTHPREGLWIPCQLPHKTHWQQQEELPAQNHHLRRPIWHTNHQALSWTVRSSSPWPLLQWSRGRPPPPLLRLTFLILRPPPLRQEDHSTSTGRTPAEALVVQCQGRMSKWSGVWGHCRGHPCSQRPPHLRPVSPWVLRV